MIKTIDWTFVCYNSVSI